MSPQLVAQPASAPAAEPTDTIQNKERRNTFKEQVHQQVHKGAAGAPHPAPHGAAPATGAKLEQRAPTPVEIKKPAATTPSPAKPAATTPSPAKPAVTQEQPAKSITPKSILPRTNSQSDDKTPEKQGRRKFHFAVYFESRFLVPRPDGGIIFIISPTKKNYSKSLEVI